MAQSPPTAGRDDAGRFGPGNPGRPRGARGRVSTRITAGILEHFERDTDSILDRILIHRTESYVGLLTRLVPADGSVVISPLEEASDEELRAKLSAIRAVSAGGGEARHVLREIESGLYGEAGRPPP